MSVKDTSTHFISIYQPSGFQFLQYPTGTSTQRQVTFSNTDARNTPDFCNELKFVLLPEGGFSIESVDGMRLTTNTEVTAFLSQSICFVKKNAPVLKNIKFNTWHLNIYPKD